MMNVGSLQSAKRKLVHVIHLRGNVVISQFLLNLFTHCRANARTVMRILKGRRGLVAFSNLRSVLITNRIIS